MAQDRTFIGLPRPCKAGGRSDRGADVTAARNTDVAPVLGGDPLAKAARARRDGQIERALEIYLEAAARFELPPADLCISITRCHDQLGTLDEAFRWLTRVVDDSDSFLHWSAAASMLSRLTSRARPH